MALSIGAWALYNTNVCWKPRNTCTHLPASYAVVHRHAL
jgi:hypothetical protein